MGIETMELICYTTYTLLLPAVLAGAAFIRVSLVSLIWLLFFLVLPCLPRFSYRNWLTHPSLRIYILLLLIASTMACCGHGVFWVLEITTDKLDVTAETMCNSTNILIMNVGYQSLSASIVPDLLDRIRLIIPDFIVFIVSVVTTILCYKCSSPAESVSPGVAQEGGVSREAGSAEQDRGVSISKIWRIVEPFITTVCLLLAGSVAPSVVSGVYFITFLVISTLWAAGVKLKGKLPLLKLFLLALSGLHIIALYLYQFREMHTRLLPDSLIARLLGFVQYYDRTCEYSAESGTLVHNPLQLTFTDNLIIGNYAFIFTLLALYFSLGLSARYMIKIGARSCCRQNFEEHESLINSVDMDSRNQENYNTLTEDPALEDAAQTRGSARGSRRHRTSSFASSYDPEGVFNQVLRFVTKLLIDQVYLLTLAILMLWSITYVSWLEFVLLLVVCFLCIWPKASYGVACPLVGYGTILVIIQFIYGLDLTNDELEEYVGIGLKRIPERGRSVLFKAIFLSVFWLHLRAYVYQQDNSVGGAPDTLIRHNRYTVTIHKFYRNIKYVILTYWPVVCYATLVGASLHSTGIDIMRIIYLVFFAIFMFCYVTARKPLELRILWLWYLLISYTMIYVVLLYTFQFPEIRKLWTDDQQAISDLGLSVAQTPIQLFSILLVPILVLLSATIQLRVFRAPPDSETEEEIVAEPDPAPPEPETIESDAPPQYLESDAAASEKKRARLKSQTYMTNLARNVADTMKKYWSDSKTAAARTVHISLAIMEMHSPKFVSLAIISVCVWRVNAINVVLLLITVTTLPWPRVQHKLTIPIFCWVCLEVFTQLMYQLYLVRSFFKDYLAHYIEVPCNTTTTFKCGYKDKSDFEWLGYYNMNTTDGLLELNNKPWNMIRGYILVIALLVIQQLLVHYMKGRRSPNVYTITRILRQNIFPDFIFPNITRESSETKMSLQLKYLCNNFFLLFGKEIVYIIHVFVAALRYDAYGFIYIILLGIWKNLSSRNKSKACMSYIVLINVLIISQYLLLVRLPPGLCLEYPWCSLQTKHKLSLIIWLYLPSTPATNNQYFILADFVLLLSMTRMWHVFNLQKLDGTLAGVLDPSPGPDYADPRNKSTLNTIKFFIFTYLWWVTAAMLFLNAVVMQMTISIFSAGFIIATFCLLWFGNSLLTKSKELLLKCWETILLYAYIVLLLKILLQLPSCITFDALTLDNNPAFKKVLCAIADIFKLVCLQKKPDNFQDNPFEDCNDTYSYNESTNLIMDAMTFMYVTIQIRLFKSPDFKHAQHYLKVLIETSAQGAMIMKHRMSLRTKMNFDAEESRLKDIKDNVAKLKAEHDSTKDFDFGTKELIDEAHMYWLQNEDRDSEAEGKPREASVCTPKPHKAEKPTGGIIVDVLKFSYQSFISFIEFTIGWLDAKSGDYRYTKTAIFKERYNNKNNPGSPRSPWSNALRGCKHDENDILEEVAPSSDPNEHIVVRLCIAIYYFYQARFELVCFLYMILNHVMNASLISMFYPLIAFLWGMIAFPRPSGIFWYIVIIYCKISIIVKYLFQFNFITWNSTTIHHIDASNPVWLPNLLGLEQTDEFSILTLWDLLILVSVFMHISCLETVGLWSLWGNEFDDLEDDTLESIVPLPNSPNTAEMIEDGEETQITRLVGNIAVDEDAIHEGGGSDINVLEDNVLEDNVLEDNVLEDNVLEDNVLQDDVLEDTVDFTMLVKLNVTIFWKLLIGKIKKDMPKDLYLPMFLSTLLALLVTVLGWSAFGTVEGQDNQDISELITTNYIPSVFLSILLVQFMVMIIDRIIYLKKSMIGKYLYQVLVVVVVHGYLFIFQPWFTRECFVSMAAWIAWYICFCCYFTLSASQIQAGYPRLSNDSIILRKYGYVTYGIYLGYLAIPFIWELEVLLNWVCTRTTLTLDYWIKYSDIKAYLFKLKCGQVTYESAYHLGEEQPAYMKYGIGGLLVLCLIFIIWFPLLFMSFATQNTIANPPIGFSCSISIPGLQPLVHIKMAKLPEALSNEDLGTLKDLIADKTKNSSSRASFNNYTEFVGKFKSPDVVRLDIFADSTTHWEVSSAAIQYLEKYLEAKSTTATTNLTMRFDWTIIRDPDSTTNSVSGYSEIQILNKSEATIPGTAFVRKSELKRIIQNCDTETPLAVNRVIPTFLLAKEKGASTYVELLPDSSHGNLKDVTLRLSHDKVSDASTCKLWDGSYYWSFNQESQFLQNFTNPITLSTNKVQFYIFSEPIFSAQYQAIASYGVVGLYISVVLVIFRFIRIVIAESSTRIIFQEMPCPDMIMKLVASTEMVRAQSEFVLEQVLFRKLLLLYRSPETLIAWTGRHRHLKEE